MAMPVLKVKEKVVVEERLARLESDVAHIQSDVTDIKGDIREMRKDIQHLDNKIDTVKDSVTNLALSTEKSFAALRESISSAKLWAVGLYIALAGGMFIVMARGFKWI